jgi:hypothetical protein
MKAATHLIMLGSTCILSISALQAAGFEDSIVWGSTTNGVSVGVLGNGGNMAAHQAMLQIWLTNSTSNHLVFVIPELPFRFNISLFDSAGVPVARTASGSSIGKRIASVSRIDEKQFGQLKRVFPVPMDLIPLLHGDKFNLFDYFTITKPGTYRLVYEQRLQVPLDRNTMQAVVFPAVITGVEIGDGVLPLREK